MTGPSEFHRPGKGASTEEIDRLRVLESYEILDSHPEQDFDRIAEAAAKTCLTPFAGISFIDKERRWFKARIGLDIQETEREKAFCHFCIESPHRVLEVPDALNDPLFKEAPLVKSPPHIRFYAAAPIIVQGERPIGTVSVMDQRPCTLSSEQRRVLEILAEQTKHLLELRRSRVQMERLHEKEISRRVVETEEEERKRIGQELHDGVVQTLAAASMHLNIIRDPEQQERDQAGMLKNLHEIIDQSVKELRGIGHSLMGKEVRAKGLKRALEDLAKCYRPIEEAPHIDVQVRIDEKRIPPIGSINLYRVAQEFVQNSIKHSGASKIQLQLHREGNMVHMLLEDDGKGLPEGKAIEESGGLGNMKHRIHSLGGKCRISSSPGAGMRLNVELELADKTGS